MSSSIDDKVDVEDFKGTPALEKIGEVHDPPDTLPESLQALSDEELKKMNHALVRKMDLLILPVKGILYILNYIDRQNLSAAKVHGIMTDLHLTTQQFATCISILFVGYLPMQIPSNLLISKIPRPGMYICLCVTVWGAISAANAAVKNYSQLMAIRACLGIVEAAFFPGAVYYCSAWYTRAELGKRVGFLYIAQQVGNAFGGIFAAAVLKLNGKHGLYGWQWLFIIEGSATVFVGFIAAFFMPEYPHNAKVLTPIQRDLAVWRIESETGAGEGKENVSALKAFAQAFADPKLYIFLFMSILASCQGSIANFFPSIVASLGYNATKSLLLSAPPYVFAAFMYYLISWGSDRTNHVYWIWMALIATSVIIYIIPMTTTNIGARYFSMMMLPYCSVGPQILMYKTVNIHLARPVSKRAAATALVGAIGGTSNIWMSYLYIGAPHYFPAFGCLLACSFLFAATLTFYRWYVLNENKKLDSGDPEKIAQVIKGGVTQEMVDLGWRYELF